MKKILIIILVLGLAFGGFLFINKENNNSSENSGGALTNQVDLTPPSRGAEINGNVQSVEGNVVIVSNEVGKEELSEEERIERKKALEELTQEEKQAQRKEERETMKTEDIELIIPVGITITKGSGDTSGDQVLAEISEIEKGMYLSIWLTENGIPEFIKIKGIGQ